MDDKWAVLILDLIIYAMYVGIAWLVSWLFGWRLELCLALTALSAISGLRARELNRKINGE